MNPQTRLETLMEDAPTGSILMSKAKKTFIKSRNSWYTCGPEHARFRVQDAPRGKYNWIDMQETDRAVICTPEGVMHYA